MPATLAPPATAPPASASTPSTTALRRRVTVSADGAIHLPTPELEPGCEAEVIVLVEEAAVEAEASLVAKGEAASGGSNGDTDAEALKRPPSEAPVNTRTPEEWEAVRAEFRAELRRRVEEISNEPAGPHRKPRPLSSLIGSGRGVYKSVEEADAFIRELRDEWEDRPS